MKYRYLGKDVEVSRFAANNTAQLTDGTWVLASMLVEVKAVHQISQALIETVNFHSEYPKTPEIFLEDKNDSTRSNISSKNISQSSAIPENFLEDGKGVVTNVDLGLVQHTVEPKRRRPKKTVD